MPVSTRPHALVRTCLSSLVFLCLCGGLAGAEEGTLGGVVRDVLGRPIPGVIIRLRDNSGLVLGTMTTDSEGMFHFEKKLLPPPGSGNCSLAISKEGFKPSTTSLNLSEEQKELNLNLESEEELVLAASYERASGPGVNPSGASDYSLSKKDIENTPQGPNARLAEIVTTMPGVSVDQNQQFHVRQTYTLQYEVNGILLPLDMYGQPSFISLINPLFIKQVDLLTGILPAQYGFANSGGVLSVETKDGSDNGGSANLQFGQRGTLQPSVQFGGTSGKFNYYVNGLYDQGNTAFSSATPGPDPIHNWTQQFQGFGLFSYKFDDTLKLSFMSLATSSNNQLPNDPTLTPAYSLNGVGSYPAQNLNNNLNFRDYTEVLALKGTPAEDLNWQLAFTSHSLRQDFLPDQVGQLIYSGVAARTTNGNQDLTLQGGVTYSMQDHTLKAGFSVGRYNISSDSNTLVFPVDSSGAQTSGSPLSVINNFRTADTIQGYYVNDLWHIAPQFDLNMGVRLDSISGFTNACQVDPTINLIYSPSSDTRIHAGYARYMDTPALQAFSPQAQASFNGTSNSQLPGLVNPYVQDDNTWDVGMAQKLDSHFDLSLDTYYTINRHFADIGQFGGVPISVGFNYDHGHTSGAELSLKYLNLTEKSRFSANLNLNLGNSYQYGVAGGQYNFSSDDLAHIKTLGILLDHQPKIGVNAGLSYEITPWTFSLQGFYSSGLRGGFVDTLQLPPVIQVDLGIQRKFGEVTNRLSILNAFDRVNLIRPAGSIGAFESAYGPRFTILDTISVPFHY